MKPKRNAPRRRLTTDPVQSSLVGPFCPIFYQRENPGLRPVGRRPGVTRGRVSDRALVCEDDPVCGELACRPMRNTSTGSPPGDARGESRLENPDGNDTSGDGSAVIADGALPTEARTVPSEVGRRAPDLRFAGFLLCRKPRRLRRTRMLLCSVSPFGIAPFAKSRAKPPVWSSDSCVAQRTGYTPSPFVPFLKKEHRTGSPDGLGMLAVLPLGFNGDLLRHG